MTPAFLKALRWIAEHQPVALFPVDGPRPTMRRKLLAAGLVESNDSFCLQLSQAGREALDIERVRH